MFINTFTNKEFTNKIMVSSNKDPFKLRVMF